MDLTSSAAPPAARRTSPAWRVAVAAWGARFATLALAGLPAFAAARAHVTEGAARSPWFVDAGRPLPAVQLVTLLEGLVPAVLPAVAVGLALAWAMHALVCAGTIAALHRARRGAPGVGLRAAWSDARASLPAFVRLAVVAAAALAGGVAALGALVDAAWEASAGAPSAWETVVVRPSSRALAALLWATAVGAFVQHTRVALVLGADGSVTRALRAVVGWWWSSRLSAPLPAVGAALFAAVCGAATLLGWRQSGGDPAWVVATVAGLAVEAAFWVAVVAHAVRGLDRTPAVQAEPPA